MMILPVYVEFVGAVSEIITNYYYWQKWKVVKKILKLKLPMNYLFLFYFTSCNFEYTKRIIYSFEVYWNFFLRYMLHMNNPSSS